MAITGVKSIAEYRGHIESKNESAAENAIYEWMDAHGFVPGYFTVTMTDDQATIMDRWGDTLKVRYDPDTKAVTEVTDDD